LSCTQHIILRGIEGLCYHVLHMANIGIFIILLYISYYVVFGVSHHVTQLRLKYN